MRRIIILGLLFSLLMALGTVSFARTETSEELNAFIWEYLEEGEPGIVLYIGSGSGEVLA